MQIIIPLAASSPFFPPSDFPFPKPLIEVGGRPMVELVVENLRAIVPNARFIFIIRHEDATRFSLSNTLGLLAGAECKVVALRHLTQGALCSALMAVDALDEDAPLVIANGDQLIDVDFPAVIERFRQQGAAAGVITFPSTHPRWSYVRLDKNGMVEQAAEKQVISRDAVAGFYYFATARQFVDAALRTIENGVMTNGQFYIAPALNEVILAGGKVAAFPVPSVSYSSFYAPSKIKEFEDREMVRAMRETSATVPGVIRLFVPAAGEGSRFREAGYPKPKPFIDVEGQAMINHVIANVRPRGSEVHLLLRREHMTAEAGEVESQIAAGFHIHAVDRLTEGTACTLLLARQAFDDEHPFLVANSDQLVDFSVDDFVNDCIKRQLDGSILVFRDADRNPKWSFARLDEHGLVQEVAEKKAISDLATVGIYLFRRGRDFVAAAVDMIARNDRVNNEFYTCPVYNYMIRNGLRIGVYEVPQSAMHGLGTPPDLDAYLARGKASR